MKTRIGQIIMTSCLMLAVGILALGVAQAQTNDARPTEPRPRPQRSAPNDPSGLARLGFGPERIFAVLTEEQRVSLRKVAGEEFGKMRELEEKLRDSRRALYQTGLLDKFDEEMVRQKAKVVAELDAEITVLRLKMLSQVEPPLSAEQLQKLSAPAPGGQSQDESPRRRRSDFQRDEHGLPPRDRVPSEPK